MKLNINSFSFFLLLLGSNLSFAGSNQSILKNSAPPWARSSNLREPADTTQYLGFRVYLNWQNADSAAQFAKAVSDPRSAQYGHYLTTQQFRKLFAPSQTQVNAVRSWLKSQGFSIIYRPDNNHYVSAEGTVAQAQTAFNVQFANYNVLGVTLRSPSSDVLVPSSLAGMISGIAGLDESWKLIQYHHVIDKSAPPDSGFRNASPLSDFWAELLSPYSFPAGFEDLAGAVPWTIKGYTPDQIKGAYGIPANYDGSGQTVAIIDAFASPTIVSDVNQWSQNRGLPTLEKGQLVQVVAPGIYHHPSTTKFDPAGWYGEETLDLEAVHGMAPGANLVYVGSPNNDQDLDAALNHVVDQHLAQIVSNSYGFDGDVILPKGFIKPLNDTLIQAAAQGIGVYFSSGDCGDNSDCTGVTSPSFPASSPWVTAVGGTALGIDQSNSIAVETGWGTSSYACDQTNDSCDTKSTWFYGAGGGESQVFLAPSYQSGMGFLGRAIPDVAALADPQTGFLIGITQTFPDGVYYDEYRIGGTSLSSPIFAGLMALADQAAGHAHGFANPLFYEHPEIFNDITSVKTAVARRNFKNSVDDTNGTSDFLRTFDDYRGSPSQHTDQGWDNVTGLGTPNASFISTLGNN